MCHREYAQFRVSAEGELQGVGLLIANEPTVNGHLLVLAPIEGGPADRAGVLPGDEVVTINGQSMEGWSGEQAARVLRGKGGTEVRVKLVRRTEGIPGVPGRPEPPPKDEYKVRGGTAGRVDEWMDEVDGAGGWMDGWQTGQEGGGVGVGTGRWARCKGGRHQARCCWNWRKSGSTRGWGGGMGEGEGTGRGWTRAMGGTRRDAGGCAIWQHAVHTGILPAAAVQRP